MNTWGHQLCGADPWDGWTFVEPGYVAEECSLCHWIDPIAANDYVPSAAYLSSVLADVRKSGYVSAFDHREVFDGGFRERLLAAGVTEPMLRELPHGLFTFDYLALPAVRCVSCTPADECAECGRVRMVRPSGPTDDSLVIEDPGDQAVVRSEEVFGRGRFRNWVVLLSNEGYRRLGLPRHCWEILA